MAYEHTDDAESQQQTGELQSAADQGTATPDATKQTSQTPSAKIPTVKTTSGSTVNGKEKANPLTHLNQGCLNRSRQETKSTVICNFLGAFFLLFESSLTTRL
ncbi:hypothetical protein JTB14_021820 [Gonioctena quinquepunctata]|nr:hypothetical protein JTB14_021820 [Gonioctena quinquepunctata]